MSDDLAQLRAATDSTIYLFVLDAEGTVEKIEAKRLRPGDLADATEFMLQARMDRQMQSAVKTNLALDQVRDMHARTLAIVQCTSISAYDVVCDPTGRIKLCQLALNRAGGKPMTFKDTKDRLAHVDLDEFFYSLCLLSGVYKLPDPKEAEKKADPLGTAEATPTATPSGLTDGASE